MNKRFRTTRPQGRPVTSTRASAIPSSHGHGCRLAHEAVLDAALATKARRDRLDQAIPPTARYSRSAVLRLSAWGWRADRFRSGARFSERDRFTGHTFESFRDSVPSEDSQDQIRAKVRSREPGQARASVADPGGLAPPSDLPPQRRPSWPSPGPWGVCDAGPNATWSPTPPSPTSGRAGAGP